MAEAALALADKLAYEGAGTVEFIYESESGRFFFIEMNTRIQVEHPVTEMLTGIDLVEEQLRVAAGQPLSFAIPSEPDERCAIELRINAEDARHEFRPAPGTLTSWRPPAGPGIRLDSHAYQGYAVPPYYDSLLGKLIVAAESRKEAIDLARRALRDFAVAGVETTIPFHADLLTRSEFARAEIHTRWVESEYLARERSLG
jgi:acetyl-CoA carboxylase biotin carboxylase subunit